MICMALHSFRANWATARCDVGPFSCPDAIEQFKDVFARVCGDAKPSKRMREAMPNDIRLELDGIKHDDGTFTAGVYENGDQLIESEFIVMRADAEDIRSLFNKVLKRYGKAPEISQSLSECFPSSFF